MSHEPEPLPPGDEVAPTLRTYAMPRDVNTNGDIFGGWVLSQMDVAGGFVAARRAGGPVATVGIEAMTFHRPILVGDEVSLYAKVERVGRTSIRVRIDTWARRGFGTETVRVTEGIFTYVALGPDRRPRPVDAPAGGGTP